MKSSFIRKSIPYLAVIIAFILIGVIIRYAKVRDINSDSRCTLNVSQSILEHGTIRLDAYLNLLAENHPCTKRISGHYYDFFPLGTSIMAVPLVKVANLAGLDMEIMYHNAITQLYIQMFMVPMIFALLLYIGRMYLPFWPAYLISLVSVLGSSLISSLSTALWSQSMGVMLVILALGQLVRHDRGIKALNPYVMGALLFMAYITRPTASIFAVMVIIYLILKDRPALIRTLAIVSVLMAGFMAFSLHNYSQPLPPYYTGRLRTGTPFFTALYGVLLSPARGLLVYSPFLALVAALLVKERGYIKARLLPCLMIAWIVLHTLTITRFGNWFGGSSYGARLFIDSFPAWVVLSFVLWERITSSQGPKIRAYVVAAVFLILGGAGVWMNVPQGLFNPKMQTWNWCLGNYSQKEDALFSWKNPPFLASSESAREVCRDGDLDLRDADRIR